MLHPGGERLQFTITEGVDSSGAVRPGHFTVVLDDGSGAPSDALMAAAGLAIEAVRPIGGTYSLLRPILLPVAVVLRVQGPADTAAAVTAAIGGYVGGLPIGAVLAVSKVVQVTHEADGLILSVSGVTLNGIAGDLGAPPFGRIVLGSVTVLS